MTDDLYARLAAPFDRHFKDPRGFEYLTGEQVVSRLNAVLGPGGWAFEVREHGCNDEAGELWVLGELAAFIGDQWVRRQQFGSQKINRSRDGGKVLDFGFDSKGATTDALKKCATLIGVGLYLAEKDGGIPQRTAEPQPPAAPAPVTAAPVPARSAPTPIKDVAPTSDRDLVRDEEDADWARWRDMAMIAEGHGVPVPVMKLGVQRDVLFAAGKKLADEVARVRRERKTAVA